MSELREVLVGRTTFKVPERIQRLDGEKLQGWQVRYAGTKLFSDSIYGDAAAALRAAEACLAHRYAERPPPSAGRLLSTPYASKQGHLPVGVSGPVWRERPGRRAYCEFKVLVPVGPRKAPKPTSVYIGNDETWEAQYDDALGKALRLRQAGEAAYEAASRRLLFGVCLKPGPAGTVIGSGSRVGRAQAHVLTHSGCTMVSARR